jgi:hypothetical protein
MSPDNLKKSHDAVGMAMSKVDTAEALDKVLDIVLKIMDAIVSNFIKKGGLFSNVQHNFYLCRLGLRLIHLLGIKWLAINKLKQH